MKDFRGKWIIAVTLAGIISVRLVLPPLRGDEQPHTHREPAPRPILERTLVAVSGTVWATVPLSLSRRR